MPDEDFVYMTHARHFVPSGGGFSKTIKCVNNEMGFGVKKCQTFDFFVVSQGGVGSSNFISQVRKLKKKTNDSKNRDGYKHLSADHFVFEKDSITAKSISMIGECATSKKVLVIIGDQNHTFYSVTRRFNVSPFNRLRQNMAKPRLPRLSRDQLLKLPTHELGIEYFRQSWFPYQNNPAVRLVTTEELYANVEENIKWIENRSV